MYGPDDDRVFEIYRVGGMEEPDAAWIDGTACSALDHFGDISIRIAPGWDKGRLADFLRELADRLEILDQFDAYDEENREFIKAALPAMQAAAAQRAAAEPQTDYFGVCPTCHKNDGCLNIGRDHWFACHEHRVKWHVGSNLFSAWRHETQEQHAENARRICDYEEVEPYTDPAWNAPEARP